MDNPTQTNRHEWGVSHHIAVSSRADVAIARGMAGGASSLHTHMEKHNLFVLLEGAVDIVGEDGETVARLDQPHDCYVAQAGFPHRMVFVDNSVLYEMYYPNCLAGEIDMDDIQREDIGWKPGEKP